MKPRLSSVGLPRVERFKTLVRIRPFFPWFAPSLVSRPALALRRFYQAGHHTDQETAKCPEPLCPTLVLPPLGRRNFRLLRGRYPPVFALTGSCATPLGLSPPSAFSLVRRVLAGCTVTGHNLCPRDSHAIFRQVSQVGAGRAIAARAARRRIRNALRAVFAFECPRPPLRDFTIEMGRKRHKAENPPAPMKGPEGSVQPISPEPAPSHRPWASGAPSGPARPLAEDRCRDQSQRVSRFIATPRWWHPATRLRRPSGPCAPPPAARPSSRVC